MESVGITDKPEVNDDDLAVQHFNETVQFKKGRYSIKWLWKPDHPSLPDNQKLSLVHFSLLVNRFQKDPNLLEKYEQVIRDKIQKSSLNLSLVINKMEEIFNTSHIIQ